MKQSEVEQGKRYTDGRGRVREATQVYRVGTYGFEGVKRVTYWTVEEGRGYVQEQDCTLATFARWARGEVET